ncbi:MAG TPA: hypothetical protein VFR57_08830 [Burkholderiales bacterium]|nr:hypothetical protein [Burkholderiales bacterium]HSA72168.1 hypothetical protein [Burkholderiales bacterium]
MLRKQLRFGRGFRVIPGNRSSQAAEMVLAPAAEGEKTEKHAIRNTGRGLLRTLNFYSPPAYRKDGKPLPRGES